MLMGVFDRGPFIAVVFFCQIQKTWIGEPAGIGKWMADKFYG
jgi:hypothetical protein